MKSALAESDYRFYKPIAGKQVSWARALFLNLTFWNSSDGADVLCDEHIAADVVAHVAWHHLVDRELSRSSFSEQRKSPAALFFAEAIASAFDLYLVGRMLRNAPESDFITTQVPSMWEVAEEAGLSEDNFNALLEQVADQPEQAFEDLRALLFGVCTDLLDCSDARQAEEVLERRSTHRFAPLLHHFQISNWVLYARAYGSRGSNEWVTKTDADLRQAPDSMAWLEKNWLASVQ